MVCCLPCLARRTQSTFFIFPKIKASDGLPNGVSTYFSVLPSKISGSSRPVPPIIPIFTAAVVAAPEAMSARGRRLLRAGCSARRGVPGPPGSASSSPPPLDWLPAPSGHPSSIPLSRDQTRGLTFAVLRSFRLFAPGYNKRAHDNGDGGVVQRAIVLLHILGAHFNELT